jgi:hypothetical protein
LTLAVSVISLSTSTRSELNVIDSTTGARLTDGPLDGPPELDGGVTGVGLLEEPPQAKKKKPARLTATKLAPNRDGLFNSALSAD